MTQEHIRVVVADDHPSVRENLRYLIDAETDLECIGVVKDGRRCIEMCRQLQPDVLVVDGRTRDVHARHRDVRSRTSLRGAGRMRAEGCPLRVSRAIDPTSRSQPIRGCLNSPPSSPPQRRPPLPGGRCAWISSMRINLSRREMRLVCRYRDIDI
ncbi:MAG: response regulator transcription factor [Chloroflexi bacterium]|nr:MAG: response regulator transcription factor [Chloroflexota bacterium]